MKGYFIPLSPTQAADTPPSTSKANCFRYQKDFTVLFCFFFKPLWRTRLSGTNSLLENARDAWQSGYHAILCILGTSQMPEVQNSECIYVKKKFIKMYPVLHLLRASSRVREPV